MGDSFVRDQIAVYFKWGEYNYWHMISWRCRHGVVCNLATELHDREFYTGSRIAVRGFDNSNMFLNLICRYEVGCWPGQTLPVPDETSSQEQCTAFCIELLECMDRETVNMILQDMHPPEPDLLYMSNKLLERVQYAGIRERPLRQE
jgi:hypothetical protein